MLTTYGMVTTRHEDLCQNGTRKFTWDYVILDEGHKIKNPTKTQSAVFGLLARHRLVSDSTPPSAFFEMPCLFFVPGTARRNLTKIIALLQVLTGTAVQNNLSELWSLYHFTHQGTLFGNLAGFKQDFENPINR